MIKYDVPCNIAPINDKRYSIFIFTPKDQKVQV